MKPQPASDPAALRRAAEARRGARPVSPATNEADLRRLQHELEVHQTELELQNAELQAARTELEAGLERYTDLYDFAPVGYFSLRADGTIHLVNLTGARLLGRERTRLLGRRFGLFVAEAGRRAFSDFLAAAFATATPQVVELELGTEGQPPRWVHLDGTLAADRQECRLAAADITERKRTELQLKASLKEIGNLTAALDEHALVAITDPRGRITYVNDKFCSISQYTRAELLGQDHRIINSGHHPKEFFRDFWTTIGRGKVWKGELKNKAKDGSFYWMDTTIAPFLDEAGKPRQYVAIRADITERKRAEDALRKRTAFLEAMIDSSADGILVVDPQKNRLYQNAKIAELYRIPRGIAENADYEAQLEFVSNRAKDPQEFRERVAFMYANPKETSRDEFELVDGTFLERTSAPVLGKDGELLGRIWHFRNVTPRKQAEAELIAGEARSRAIVEASPVPMALNDADQNILFVNPAFTQTFGYELADIPTLGDWWPKAYPDPVYRQWVAESWQRELERSAQTGTAFVTLELHMRCKDGTGRIVMVGAAPLEDAFAGTHLVVLHDITERKRAEEALRESRHVLEQAQAAGHIGSWVSEPGPPARLVWSAETGRIFGVAPGGFDGRPESFSALVHPEDREAVARAAQAALAGGPAYDLEHRIVRPDGQVRWVHEQADVERDPAGRPVRLVGVVQDITDSRQAQAELHRREEHFRSLIENASDLITVLDGAGVIRFQSPSSERVLGYRPAELTGRNAFEFIHPDDTARMTAALQRAHGQSGVQMSEDFRFRHRDGGWRLVQSVGRSLPGEAAEPLVVVNSRDITDRKHLEEQLRQAQKMEAIGQLAGGIAHDFNNILGTILGNAELLRLLLPGDPETGECLDDILAGGRRAADLVGQILTFSRRQESTRQPLELPPLVREVLKLLRATVPANVEFRAQLASVPTVLADPTAIHQVLMNLCTNAWHALQGRAGLIRVSLEETALDEAFTRRHPDLRPGRYVCLTVADSGCGMDEATLGRIFEPFFTTKPVGTGTGLGLSVVHGIMKNHDGGIVVRSRPGEGTTFQLYFPQFVTETGPAAAAAHPVPRGAGEHILFVDDEVPLARMGQAMLERLGYRVTRFTSPAGALAAFRAEPDGFDLIVVDHNMPEMNGTEFGAQVLAIRPGQRIVLTTGYSAILSNADARTLGFRELMPKPYDLRRLGETVHRVLHETGARP